MSLFTPQLANIASGTNSITDGGFNIGAFRAIINQKSVLKNNLFLTNFPVPKCLNGKYGTNNRDLFYYTENLELPGVTLSTADSVRRYGFGPTEKFAFVPVFQDIQFNFIMDGKGDNRKFFDDWMLAIGGFSESKGITSDKNPINNFNPYELEYKDNYVVDINISVFNEVAETILTYTLRDAFPVALVGSQLNWAAENELMSLGIAFTYRDWFSNSSSSMRSGSISGAGKELLNAVSLSTLLQQNQSLSQTFNPSFVPTSISDISNVVFNGSADILGS